MNWTCEFPVRYDDLDAQGHVGSARWLTVLERARVDMLEQIAVPFHELQRRGVGAVVAEAHLQFLRPARFGDRIVVRITPTDPSESGLKLRYSVLNQESKALLRAWTTMVFVDLDGRRSAMPDDVRDRLFDDGN